VYAVVRAVNGSYLCMWAYEVCVCMVHAQAAGLHSKKSRWLFYVLLYVLLPGNCPMCRTRPLNSSINCCCCYWEQHKCATLRFWRWRWSLYCCCFRRMSGFAFDAPLPRTSAYVAVHLSLSSAHPGGRIPSAAAVATRSCSRCPSFALREC
jgi:hypothetical protein